jgi:uncharacterized protein
MYYFRSNNKYLIPFACLQTMPDPVHFNQPAWIKPPEFNFEPFFSPPFSFSGDRWGRAVHGFYSFFLLPAIPEWASGGIAMFKNERESYQFRWADIGDIELGRPNLGNGMNVAVYRLMQYSMRDVMIKMLSVEKANEVLCEAGRLAGREFCLNVLDRTLPFNEFISQLQEKLLSLMIGILRIEKSDLERMEFILTVEEDLDCSGLPVVGETVCEYDEGFIAGLFETYTGRRFEAREIDCWASGERVCRFKVVMINK